ncbi:hypothetical protein C8R45DRAFT_1127827 [Mycena sanguinolenta]|nr:hypothetical protein C8R45DRAFT_1127827 [Mycena sanguinolenta]
MDIDAYILHQQLEDMEDNELEDQQRLAAIATAIIVLGAIEARRLRAERRKLSRLYLCRVQLLSNPRITTPWQVLYETQNDCANPRRRRRGRIRRRCRRRCRHRCGARVVDVASEFKAQWSGEILLHTRSISFHAVQSNTMQGKQEEPENATRSRL